jgi:hypothetical protein
MQQTVLTLFSVRADSGSLFVVAANSEAVARALVLARLDRGAVVESSRLLGNSDLFDEAQVVDQSAS